MSFSWGQQLPGLIIVILVFGKKNTGLIRPHTEAINTLLKNAVGFHGEGRDPSDHSRELHTLGGGLTLAVQ